MNSQQLLFINIVIFAGLAVSVAFVRAKRRQKLLQRSSKAAESFSPPIEEKKETEPAVVQVEAPSAPEPVAPTPVSTTRVPNPLSKQGHVFFMFNGHEWNAHEVLGCSPQATLDQVTHHYQNLLKTEDVSTFDFYEAAHRAILKSKRY